MALSLNPLGDKVVVERSKAGLKTRGGIILPDNAKDKPKQGMVIAVGEGKVLDNGSIRQPSVKIGDKILFGTYAGTEVKVDEKEYLIINESDILAIITEEK